MFASKKLIAVAALATLVSCNVFAAGFEKAVLWSGHYGGLGGAGTSDVSGAEGLYFNPAGIGMDHAGHQVQLDVSPTIIDSSADFGGSNHDSKSEFLPPYAVLYDWTMNDKLAFAIGSYTGGGLADEYDNISIGGVNSMYKTSLRSYEFAAGVSYKVMPKFKVGAEFREIYTTAEFDAASLLPGPTVVQQNIKDLKGWSSSYRLGAMWTDSVWGAGLSFRGPADFNLKGSADLTANGTTSVARGSDTHVKNQLPLELSVGGHYDFMTHLRGYLEYAWTHYGHDQTLIIDGSAANNDVAQNWSDQHQVRIAAEYSEMAWPVRVGYVYTTAVENKATEISNFAPPGDGHTFTIGTGHALCSHMTMDGAFEYSFSHASGITGPAASGGEFAGKETADVYALHLGLAYNF